MNFKNWLLKEETSNESPDLSPIVFRKADISDIIDFVEELLYKTKNIDITEKIAGQHLTVTIKDNFAYVNTKDSLVQNKEPKNAMTSRYGSSLTSGIIRFLKKNKIPDQIWRFEIIHPSHNHDYIKYKNLDEIYVEYSGALSEDIAKEIRKYISVKLLTKNDIRVKINQTQKFHDFRNKWEKFYKNKLMSLDATRKGRYYNNLIDEIKYNVGDVLEDALVSVIDNQSPIEGIVVGTKIPIKIQTNTFLKVQKAQMPLFSIFKMNKNEIPFVLENPNVPFQVLKEQHNLEFTSIYAQNLGQSLFTTVKSYLLQNNKLDDIDTEKYIRWLTPEESRQYTARLTEENVVEIYKELYAKIMAK